MAKKSKKKTEDYKFRDRKFMLMLYPDDSSHVAALDLIKKSYDHLYIRHDRDYYTEEDIKAFDDIGYEHNYSVGEIKKAHYHVVIRTTNGVWNSALADTLGITMNYIQQIRNLNNALEYLIHLNDSEKAQYNVSECKGNLMPLLLKSINNSQKEEGEKVGDLIDYIEQQNERIYIKTFARYCASQGYWSDFRRNASILFKIIDEHNYKFNKKEDEE